MKVLHYLALIFTLLFATHARAADDEVDLAALLDDPELMEKLAPMAKLLPKALPLLQGQVKDAACKKKGKELTKRAGSVETLDAAMELLCELGDECALAYIEGVKGLLKLEMVKNLLKLAPDYDVEQYIEMAPFLYTSMCAGQDNDDEAEEAREL